MHSSIMCADPAAVRLDCCSRKATETSRAVLGRS